MSNRHQEDNRYYFSGWNKHGNYDPYEPRRDREREYQGDYYHRQRALPVDRHRAHSGYDVGSRQGRYPDERQWDGRGGYQRDVHRPGERESSRVPWSRHSAHSREYSRDNIRQPATKDRLEQHGKQPSTKGSVEDTENQAPSRNGPVYEDHRFGRDRHRVHYERVFILIEHGAGRHGNNVCDEIEREIRTNFNDGVFLTVMKGKSDAFEVYINGKLLYSRLKVGGYPHESDVIMAIDNVRHGRNFSELRHGQTKVCVIL